MGTYINPLDLKTILLEYFLGNVELLVFALIIIISYASAYYQMSNNNFLLILVISSLLFSLYLGEAIYLFILILVGFVVFKGVAKMVQ